MIPNKMIIKKKTHICANIQFKSLTGNTKQRPFFSVTRGALTGGKERFALIKLNKKRVHLQFFSLGFYSRYHSGKKPNTAGTPKPTGAK